MSGSWPQDLLKELEERLTCSPFSESFVAVRSSGTDEDSAAHSFAGNAGFAASVHTLVDVAKIMGL